jgi:hypothetical protein
MGSFTFVNKINGRKSQLKRDVPSGAQNRSAGCSFIREIGSLKYCQLGFNASGSL